MRSFVGVGRRSTALAVLLVALASLPASAVPPPGRATGPRDCEPVRGTFTNQFLTGPVCEDSPIGLCTEGQLQGDLTGTYRFTFLSSAPVGASPVVSAFTGLSEIQLAGGTLSGQDFGVLRVPRPPAADFTTHLTITGGTGQFQGATGHLVIQGAASLADGAGEGTYVGKICLPREPPGRVARITPGPRALPLEPR